MYDPIGLRVKDLGAGVRFFETSLAAGGGDNGPPGLRPDYSPTCYGAFVIDLDGNNIEAVCYAKEA